MGLFVHVLTTWGLNALTVCYPYPLPLVSAALEQLQGAKIFTKLDLWSVYNLIQIQEGHDWKMAFNTARVHYEYLVMPYGLTNTPAVFQSLVNEIFKNILNQFVIAYIDDILIYKLEDHIDHVHTVLTRLLQKHLYVKFEKSEFHCTTLTFLGYVLSMKGEEMDQSKVQTIANFYCRFILNYSTIASPLTSLLKGKQKRLSWSDLAREAFIRLKNSFTTAPILRHPDSEIPFVVEVDTSSCGIGAVLSQCQPDSGKLHPCAYFSRKLTTAEANYDVGNRELLYIKAALEEWCRWMEGAPHPFLVLTDHRNLKYLHGDKYLNPHQARWALLFTRFNFSVTYRPGSKNDDRRDMKSPHQGSSTGRLLTF